MIDVPEELRELHQAIENAGGTTPCSTTDPDAWFPDKDDSTNMTAMAKKLCGSCPVQIECLRYAISNEIHGIWGGLNYRDRLKLRPAQHGKKVGS